MAILTSRVIESAEFQAARRAAAEGLLAERTSAGHWRGGLSSSALATATALTALRIVDAETWRGPILAGVRWLVSTQLADGSWGDTTASRGNLSTTLLAWSALAAAVDEPALGLAEDAAVRQACGRAAELIAAHTRGLDQRSVAGWLERFYGRDRTFAVPILTHATLCGRFGDPRDRASWADVPQLPFELAALPRSWFRVVDLQVVSYALPALIAIGSVRHTLAPRGGPWRLVRDAARPPTLARLAAIQPGNGGFLEATPLTSFVTMSLAGSGLRSHEVVRRGVGFLVASMRADGSWPIDTDLATWVSTQSLTALAAGGRLGSYLDAAARTRLREWLLGQQWRDGHPYTGAAPGGWAWTDLPGGVPDADDTSGAVVGLAALDAAGGPSSPRVAAAASAGLGWLVNLANRDGGIPTFCRGWGRLPFDMSCPDITAHFLRAAASWDRIPREAGGPWAALEPRLQRARRSAARYLRSTQAADGSWSPLWFGNERHTAQANPTYGTAKVVAATLDRRGAEWLLAAMHADGGFGGGPLLPPSIEETAIATEALACVAIGTTDASLRGRAAAAVKAGVRWLVEHTAGGTHFEPTPIGLYFAKLWYFEDLYPLVFTVGALERATLLTDAGTPSAD